MPSKNTVHPMDDQNDDKTTKGSLDAHDALFKAAFSKTENAVGLLKAIVPAVVVDRIDWSDIRLEPGAYVDPALAKRYSDLLFSVPFAGRRGFIYLLLDHKSGPDKTTAYHLLVYCVRIWEDWRSEHPKASRIPAILPLVVHHSKRDGADRATSVTCSISTPSCSRCSARTYPPFIFYSTTSRT